jgi:DNA helicase IV
MHVIEWVILGLAGVGLNALFGSKERAAGTSSNSGGRGRIERSGQSHDKAYSHQKEIWRAQWDNAVDRTKWIPSGTASYIIERFPPPRPPSGLRFFLLGGDGPRQELQAEFAAHNANYLVEQKRRLKHFFDTVEKKPLTDEQMVACICMDDSLQIVAAAGSGKTSTMVAKAGYILHEKLASPEQVLVLAFNRDAAAELKQRIRSRLADVDGIECITAMTFNAFGLRVIAKATGKAPSVAPWVGTSAQEVTMIVSIVDDLRSRDPAFGKDWDLFRTVYGRDVGQRTDANMSCAAERGKAVYQTADGTFVKSQEERLIADWLFYHGVRYEYERDYQHETADETYRQYKPDFYYPDAELYHEHFALDGEGKPPSHFDGDYLAGVRWKRALHAEHGTGLFETTSHSLRVDTGLMDLAKELVRRGVEPRYDCNRPVKGPPPLSTQALARLIRAFQQHVKGGGLSLQQLHAGACASLDDGHLGRSARFLTLYSRIADEWERRLRECGGVDFDDMINMAAEHIESGRFASPFTIILADEFQDSSRARVRLLKALRGKAGDAGHLCVVGDDWQGINGFAGADISVMTEFANTFAHASQLLLTTTFRCPPDLCEASSAFVCANPKQIRKAVTTTGSHDAQAIVAVALRATEEMFVLLTKQLERLHHQAAFGRLKMAEDRRIEVLLVGRYNHEKPAALGAWRRRFGDRLDIEFRTVHRSKGLEADYVMILNVVEDTLGFPSQVEDDPLLQLAMPTPDPFPMAEERRLFYVALTRARRQVRIYTISTKPSRFLLEMAQADLIKIGTTGGGSLTLCPKCRQSFLRYQNGKYGVFEFCGAPACDFKRDVAAKTSTAPALTPRVKIGTPLAPGEACPSCEIGKMVERPRARFGAFVGCSAYPDCMTTAPLLVSEAQAKPESAGDGSATNRNR